jgi:hypothetical protein
LSELIARIAPERLNRLCAFAVKTKITAGFWGGVDNESEEHRAVADEVNGLGSIYGGG